MDSKNEICLFAVLFLVISVECQTEVLQGNERIGSDPIWSRQNLNTDNLRSLRGIRIRNSPGNSQNVFPTSRGIDLEPDISHPIHSLYGLINSNVVTGSRLNRLVEVRSLFRSILNTGRLPRGVGIEISRGRPSLVRIDRNRQARNPFTPGQVRRILMIIQRSINSANSFQRSNQMTGNTFGETSPRQVRPVTVELADNILARNSNNRIEITDGRRNSRKRPRIRKTMRGSTINAKNTKRLALQDNKEINTNSVTSLNEQTNNKLINSNNKQKAAGRPRSKVRLHFGSSGQLVKTLSTRRSGLQEINNKNANTMPSLDKHVVQNVPTSSNTRIDKEDTQRTLTVHTSDTTSLSAAAKAQMKLSDQSGLGLRSVDDVTKSFDASSPDSVIALLQEKIRKEKEVLDNLKTREGQIRHKLTQLKQRQVIQKAASNLQKDIEILQQIVNQEKNGTLHPATNPSLTSQVSLQSGPAPLLTAGNRINNGNIQNNVIASSSTGQTVQFNSANSLISNSQPKTPALLPEIANLRLAGNGNNVAPIQNSFKVTEPKLDLSIIANTVKQSPIRNQPELLPVNSIGQSPIGQQVDIPLIHTIDQTVLGNALDVSAFDTLGQSHTSNQLDIPIVDTLAQSPISHQLDVPIADTLGQSSISHQLDVPVVDTLGQSPISHHLDVPIADTLGQSPISHHLDVPIADTLGQSSISHHLDVPIADTLGQSPISRQLDVPIVDTLAQSPILHQLHIPVADTLGQSSISHQLNVPVVDTVGQSSISHHLDVPVVDTLAQSPILHQLDVSAADTLGQSPISHQLQVPVGRTLQQSVQHYVPQRLNEHVVNTHQQAQPGHQLNVQLASMLQQSRTGNQFGVPTSPMLGQPQFANQHMHSNFMLNRMNPFMNPFQGLPSDVMQELMFGDTTDPPDPTDPPTTAPPSTTTSIPTTTTTAPATTTVKTTTFKPIQTTTKELHPNQLSAAATLQDILSSMQLKGIKKGFKIMFTIPGTNKTIPVEVASAESKGQSVVQGKQQGINYHKENNIVFPHKDTQKVFETNPVKFQPYISPKDMRIKTTFENNLQENKRKPWDPIAKLTAKVNEPKPDKLVPNQVEPKTIKTSNVIEDNAAQIIRNLKKQPPLDFVQPKTTTTPMSIDQQLNKLANEPSLHELLNRFLSLETVAPTASSPGHTYTEIGNMILSEINSVLYTPTTTVANPTTPKQMPTTAQPPVRYVTVSDNKIKTTPVYRIALNAMKSNSLEGEKLKQTPDIQVSQQSEPDHSTLLSERLQRLESIMKEHKKAPVQENKKPKTEVSPQKPYKEANKQTNLEPSSVLSERLMRLENIMSKLLENSNPARESLTTEQTPVEEAEIQASTTTPMPPWETPSRQHYWHTSNYYRHPTQYVPPETTTTASPDVPCHPSLPNFACEGIGMFQSMQTIAPWCVSKCVQGQCVESVCQCGCYVNSKPATLVHEIGNEIASVFSGQASKNSENTNRALNELLASLNNNLSTKSPTDNPTTTASTPLDVKSMLSSIEKLIEAKLANHKSNTNDHSSKGPSHPQRPPGPINGPGAPWNNPHNGPPPPPWSSNSNSFERRRTENWQNQQWSNQNRPPHGPRNFGNGPPPPFHNRNNYPPYYPNQGYQTTTRAWSFQGRNHWQNNSPKGKGGKEKEPAD